jgi:DedD protein
MRGAFDDRDYLEQRKSSGDAEITLGAGTMLLLTAGLAVVCGVCFGAGYMVGHRGTPQQAAAAQQIDGARTNTQASSMQQKPSATAQAAVPAPIQPAAQSDNATQQAPSEPSQSSAVTVPVPSTPSVVPPAGQPQVRPALPAPSQPAPAFPSHPAYTPAQQQAQLPVRSASIPPTVALWVQIAAVTHVEDAQVLTTALRKRGYTVTPRREADNLIHVRIGPFSTRDDANRWRAKLLDDGYNAEIQQ